jgi:hypothetical protein
MADSNGLFDVLYSAAVTGTKAEVSVVPVDIGGYHILNNAAAISYVQVFYLPAASVTVGTTVANFVIPLPASGGATAFLGAKGLRTRGTGLTLACTTTRTGSTTATADVLLFRAR